MLKFGGNAIREQADLVRLSEEIAALIRGGAKVVLVHGGGPEISAAMEELGMVPRKVCGLRVTGPEVMEVTEKVLRGLNDRVTECLESVGVPAVGLPGYQCTLCKKREPVKMIVDGEEVIADLGLVGEVIGSDSDMLLDLLEAGVTPVIYPVGKDSEGQMLNVNADSMVAGIAAGTGCREMVTVTDVPGIMTDPEDPSTKLDWVTLGEIDRMISEGVITGGMLPKVEACRKVLLAGVPTVRMVDGTDPDCIVSDVMTNGSRGTLITG